MQALVLSASGDLTLADGAMPAAAPGECLLRVRLAGICNTDLELRRGYRAFAGIPGHEFVADVVTGPAELQGRRVVGDINVGCGRCARCRAGLQHHCAQRTVLGIQGRPGCFAEYCCLPAANLISVPEALPDDAAVFAEPLAAALEILEQVRIPHGAPVLVLGDGKLGLLCAQVLQVHGCRVRLRGRHAAKLALAQGWGVTTELADAAPSADVYPYVVEATGAPTGLQTALAATEPRGVLILKSTCAPDRLPQLDWSPVVVREITIVGSRCGPLAEAVRWLAAGMVDVASLIAGRRPLTRGVEAFDVAARPGTLKVLLDIGWRSGTPALQSRRPPLSRRMEDGCCSRPQPIGPGGYDTLNVLTSARRALGEWRHPGASG